MKRIPDVKVLGAVRRDPAASARRTRKALQTQRSIISKLIDINKKQSDSLLAVLGLMKTEVSQETKKEIVWKALENSMWSIPGFEK